MASSISRYNLSGFHAKANTRYQTLPWNHFPDLSVSRNKHQTCLVSNKCSLQWSNKRKRNLFLCAAAPSPPSEPSSNFLRHILALVMTIILPFFSKNMGPLWSLKNKIERTMETVEQIANSVEKVAEEVDKVVEDIADDLPEGKLKNLVNLVEDVAEKTAKHADSLGDLIDKVQEAEDQVESMVESLVEQANNKSPKEP